MFEGKLGKLLAVLQGILEIEAFVLMVHGFDLPPFWRVFLPLGAHAMAVALMAVGLSHRWDFRRGSDRAWAVVGMCLTLPLPLFGWLGFVLVYSMMAMQGREQGELLKDFQSYITYEPNMAPDARLPSDSDRFIMDEVDVAPLREILVGNDLALKRGAIMSLARLPRREAVDLLDRSLSDESREIRYYASNALSEMEKEFNDRIFRLIREIERKPTTVDRHVELARTVLDYAGSGLLDEGMVPHFLELGLRALDRAALVPNSTPLVLLYSGLLQKQAGRTDKAVEALEAYLARMPDDADALVTLAELVFDRRQGRRARELIEEGARRFPGDSRFADLVELVGGGA
jgi:tetratricopeptide (TPR) repeat protein